MRGHHAASRIAMPTHFLPHLKIATPREKPCATFAAKALMQLADRLGEHVVRRNHGPELRFVVSVRKLCLFVLV